MAELELEGLHADGEHLALVGPDGRRYRLRIDDALRAAVRRDRPRLEQFRTAGHLRPRDIQTRLRAGASVEEVAREAGVPVEHIRRYEGPVSAERTWVAQQARSITIGRESGAPRLGELVVDRLASRGVPAEDLAWTAVRRPGEPWELVLTFWAADREREARWTVDVSSRSLHAVDDEGRWLSEVELGGGEPPRRLAPVRVRGYEATRDDVGADEEVAPPAPPDAGGGAAGADAPITQESGGATAALLDELRASRGIRPEVSRLDDESLLAEDPPAAHPPASTPDAATDAAVLPLPRSSGRAEPAHDPELDPGSTPAEGPGTPPRRSRGRPRRTSVPSWDEIVFGAKPE